jgi:competence protein ComEA
MDTVRSSFGKAAGFVAIGVLLIAAIAIMLSARPQGSTITVLPLLPTATTTPQGDMLIWVTGAVANPEQMITLPPNSRVQEVIAAAGGASPNADLTAVNLAAVVRDGDQIHVPELAVQVSITATAQGGTQLVYINSASIEEIVELPGIGVVLAEAIVAHRTVYGRFTQLSDLDAVDGIGEGLLRQIAAFVIFD